MMIGTWLRLVLLLIASSAAQAAEPAARQFLRYIYGAEGIDVAAVSHPSDDLWMVRGARNPEALATLDKMQFEARSAGITSGTVKTDLFFVEMRDGKVDPAFNLDGIYFMHRQLVLHFVYAVLTGDERKLAGLTTDASKVEIVGTRAMPGEMGQYAAVIGLIPVVRASMPADDARSRSVTYRIPISTEGLALRLIKDGNTWKIDTSKGVSVPLQFFFRGNGAR
jgi:hypothetical protein